MATTTLYTALTTFGTYQLSKTIKNVPRINEALCRASNHTNSITPVLLATALVGSAAYIAPAVRNRILGYQRGRYLMDIAELDNDIREDECLENDVDVSRYMTEGVERKELEEARMSSDNESTTSSTFALTSDRELELISTASNVEPSMCGDKSIPLVKFNTEAFEVKNTRSIRKGRKKTYAKRVLEYVKVRFGTPKFTIASETAVRNYARAYMNKQGLRNKDAEEIVSIVTALTFLPSRAEMKAAEGMNDARLVMKQMKYNMLRMQTSSS